MWLNEWYKRQLGRLAAGRGVRPTAPRRRGLRPTLEPLEDRTLPSAYTAASVADLIADINAANKHGGSNTITLAANSRFTLTAVDNATDGATGLPVIKKADNLTILGNADTIERSTAAGTPAFRLFDVARGGSLTLANLTLQNGLASGTGIAADGGAIYNQGTLILNAVTVQNNVAYGSPGKNGTSKGNANGGPGGDAAGGGIWSNGSLTLENGTDIQGNRAVGGPGGDAYWYDTYFGGYFDGAGGKGGQSSGGGLYMAGGTANLAGATLSGNTASGGDGGLGFGGRLYGGDGFGGGLYVAAGIVSLRTDTVVNNTARGGYGSSNGAAGYGGGLYLVAGATAYFDAFTLANTRTNTADFFPDIDGSYTLQS
jgi:hypothetical protein